MTISMIGLPSKMVKPNSEDEDRKRLRNREVGKTVPVAGRRILGKTPSCLALRGSAWTK